MATQLIAGQPRGATPGEVMDDCLKCESRFVWPRLLGADVFCDDPNARHGYGNSFVATKGIFKQVIAPPDWCPKKVIGETDHEVHGGCG